MFETYSLINIFCRNDGKRWKDLKRRGKQSLGATKDWWSRKRWRLTNRWEQRASLCRSWKMISCEHDFFLSDNWGYPKPIKSMCHLVFYSLSEIYSLPQLFKTVKGYVCNIKIEKGKEMQNIKIGRWKERLFGVWRWRKNGNIYFSCLWLDDDDDDNDDDDDDDNLRENESVITCANRVWLVYFQHW